MNIDQFLASFQRFGVNLGLTRIEKLLTQLGNPEKNVPLIHVAGTNGKGSVCAYLSSVLTTAGYKVGRYTSPHLVTWTERICLNELPISEADLLAILEQVKAAIGEEDHPTLFEVVTAAAWLYFAEQQVDVAVMEVGLGGRLDATNVKEEVIASIITPISREHWQVLGDTIGKI
ncbi:MAG: Mur ligase family protein, partial [Halothece sp. Uz-M2-17]|nr:Mur ligase family protein [Halothece sp. Uz-M2-17]